MTRPTTSGTAPPAATTAGGENGPISKPLAPLSVGEPAAPRGGWALGRAPQRALLQPILATGSG